MSEQACRWGILSTATIARKNWMAILNTGNAVVAAVASRDQAKAQQFIDECQREAPFSEAPTALGSYEQLLSSDGVDAVYIPLPTALRKEWVIKAAEAGKHVVCEKPCAVTATDLAEMIDACKSNQVQFMDGVMYMHSERLTAVRQILDAGERVGQIKRIVSQFSFRAPDEFLTSNIRVNSDLEPQGCLGDLGWYTIRFALWAMNYQMPREVTGRLLSQAGREDSPNKVPTEFSGELLFHGGVSASFYNSFLTEHQQWVNVSGSNGQLTISDFVLPNYGNELMFETSNPIFDVNGCRFRMEKHVRRHDIREYSDGHETAQETKLFRTFSELVQTGKRDDHWPSIALKTQRIMDACLQSAHNDSQPVSIDG